LIGALIVRDLAGERTIARIVETEAYVPGDAAAHSFRGRTARNGSLFLERGHAYVYFIYGNHYCFNVSAGSQGIGAGVLVRAGEPLEGIEVMRRRRGAVADRDLLRGPGRLAQALAIGRAQDGLDLCAAGPLWLAHGAGAPVKIGVSRRIGLTKEIDRPLRFFDRASKVVSGPRLLS
jgi:DNA-3-methyladenine glycosylase